ncbi:general substrate transporter [Flagelloscypha sp. PMI_526]|nr:general substrate transporter [Flagelloscypha sp. PMI_526]
MHGKAGPHRTTITVQQRKEIDVDRKSGAAGLIQNRHVFATALFTSLGGLQNLFGDVLGMNSFQDKMALDALPPNKQGWMVSIIVFGAWFGALSTGILADLISRKYTIVLATFIFCIGVIVQTAASAAPAIFGGRFIVGIGVGSLNVVVPLYNAELAPREIRGSLVALQQLAVTFGFMISYWIDFGTDGIGGSEEAQKEAAWRLPLGIQLVPAIILGVGILFQPFSPRWLVSKQRDEEAKQVLSKTQRLPIEHKRIVLEYKEIKAQHLFDVESSKVRFPHLQDGSWSSRFKLGIAGYARLFRTKSLFYRVAISSVLISFQQWSGLSAILYYAVSIFRSLGLTKNDVSLLATGVVSIAMFLATIPTVLWVDRFGRKPVLISGAFVMAASLFVVGGLSATHMRDWSDYPSAAWAAGAFVWIFCIAYGYSWGPCSYIIASEIWPLRMRGKGSSIASNKVLISLSLVGQAIPTMFIRLTYGTLIFFGCLAFLGGLFVLFFVPETKCMYLEEMGNTFPPSVTFL